MKKAFCILAALCTLIFTPIFILNAMASSSECLNIGDGNITLNKGGDYTITGSTNKNCIKIYNVGTFNITLDSLSMDLKNQDSIPIQIFSETAKINLILAEGSENTIETNGCVAVGSKCVLSISGSGNLTSNSGISAKSGITISASGNITLNSSIYCNDYLTVNGNGNITIISASSGIICREGDVNISNGTTKINLKNDKVSIHTDSSGISGECGGECKGIESISGAIKISGGQLDVSVNGIKSAIGLTAPSIKITDNAYVNIQAASEKGYACGIEGSYYLLKGSNSFNSILTTGNTFIMSDGTLNISSSSEEYHSDGLSCNVFTFTGGSINITGNEDGINTGESLAILGNANLTVDVEGNGIMATSPTSIIELSGGTVTISCLKNAVSSNRDINITGGTLTTEVSCDGSVDNAYGIFSEGGKIVISGGTVVAKVYCTDKSKIDFTGTGIYSNNETSISGGKITASGTTNALGSIKKSINIASNLIIFAGDNAEDATVVSAYSENKYIYILSEAAWENPFSDVAGTDWFYNSVAYVNCHGLISGTGINTFSPYQSVSRAMIATIIWRIGGKPEATETNTLKDVNSSSYYAKAATWAVENNIMAGNGSETFEPDKSPSREQLALLLYRYAQYKDYDVTAEVSLSCFTDSDIISADAVDAVMWAVNRGIISGNGNGALDPSGLVNRAQLAAILQRFLVMY